MFITKQNNKTKQKNNKVNIKYRIKKNAFIAFRKYDLKQ